MTVPASPPSALAGIPPQLRDPLLEAFNEVVRNYRERRWEPSELNGGKLCEVVYSILKGHADGAWPAGPSKPRDMVAACNALASAGTTFSRSVRIQIPRMLIVLYEIRNNRNVGHVGADVNPNEMDASVVLHMSQWVMAELVRLFHNTTAEEATVVVSGLVERTVPLLWRVGNRTRVLGAGLSARDKMMVLLYGSAGELPVTEVAATIEYSNMSRFRSDLLKAAHKADLIDFDRSADVVRISPLGVRYVEQNVKLTL